MKPEFSKPFNLEHARAGAPIGKSGGGTARFVTYAEEADPSCCVVVIEDHFNLIGARRKSGRVNETGATDNPNDLVMLPLGLIDGKPVFVGDELHDRWSNTVHAYVGMGLDPCHWAWPAPPRVFPVTLMAAAELDAAWVGADALRRVANAALRHAIDAGQLIEPGDRAARDMAVAVAVRNVAQSARPVARDHELSEDVSELVARIAQLDLAVIIAAIN